MMNHINRITDKYGSYIMISIGILFILLGLILQFKGVETTDSFNARSRFNSELKSVISTPSSFSYFIAAFFILLGSKKEWIFKKKKRTRAKQAKVLKLNPEKEIILKEPKKRRRSKVIKLDT